MLNFDDGVRCDCDYLHGHDGDDEYQYGGDSCSIAPTTDFLGCTCTNLCAGCRRNRIFFLVAVPAFFLILGLGFHFCVARPCLWRLSAAHPAGKGGLEAPLQGGSSGKRGARVGCAEALSKGFDPSVAFPDTCRQSWKALCFLSVCCGAPAVAADARAARLRFEASELEIEDGEASFPRRFALVKETKRQAELEETKRRECCQMAWFGIAPPVTCVTSGLFILVVVVVLLIKVSTLHRRLTDTGA
jgi:hypothetical protein